MQNPIRLLFIVSLLAAGCGSTGLRTVSPPTATIEGLVMGAGSHALRVDVPGTSASTTTDSRGGFVLLKVPAGASSLRFRGPGVDASLSIASLRAREHRTLAVKISHGRARQMHESTATEFSGKVVAVKPPSLQVDDRTVATTDATAIEKDGQKIALDAIQVGDFVDVEGSLQGDGTVLALKITVRRENPGDGEEHDVVHFHGPLMAIDGMHLTVGVLPVEVTTETALLRGDKPITLGELKIGEELAVVATIDAVHGIVALEIRVLAEDQDLQIFGFIEAIDAEAQTITIGDVPLQYDDQTQFAGAGDPHSAADLHEGDLVGVQAVHLADGSFYARSVVRVPPPPPPGQFDFQGAVNAVDAEGLSVAGKRFAVDGKTVIRRGDATIQLSDLKVGEQVDVEAMPRPDAPPLATLIVASAGG